MDVMDYKNQGYLPEALLNFLVKTWMVKWWPRDFSMEEMLELFDPSNINKSASAYNAEKLFMVKLWIYKSCFKW